MTDDEARAALAYLLMYPMWAEEGGWGSATPYVDPLLRKGYLETYYITDSIFTEIRITPAGLEFFAG